MSEAAKENSSKKEKKRIHTLDELRGFAVFCMVFYHAFYTVGYLFNFDFGVKLIEFFMPAEPFFAGLFILISGIASNLSHSNLERGCKLLFIAEAVTVVTFLVVGEDQVIRFGVLHMLAVSMIAFGLLRKVVGLVPMWIGIILNVLLFVFTLQITRGYVGIPFLYQLRLPVEWYSSGIFYALGFPSKDFVSSDYFPLMPWLFLFFAGGFFGKLAADKKFPAFTYKKHIPPLAFLGRHALLVYILHQPVIYGICSLVKLIIGSNG